GDGAGPGRHRWRSESGIGPRHGHSHGRDERDRHPERDGGAGGERSERDRATTQGREAAGTYDGAANRDAADEPLRG
ncbi:MAG: hypothetical protein JWO86_4284, partial [Myxococcaceae bacterium]|nr:hypothetical protein [Myxococcaceae bacterium]